MSIKSEEFTGDYFAAVGIGVFADLVEIIVPAKAVMKLLDYANFLDVPAAWGVCWWEFFIDDMPTTPYAIVFDRVSFGTGRQVVRGNEITGGHHFRIRAQNPTAGIVRMGVSLRWRFEYPDQI
jgi:hypothetical protein